MDLFVNFALVATSAALFCYWFRYGCLLILAAQTPHDYSKEVAEVNRLSFPTVRAKLRNRDASALECLHKCLERDFTVVAYLLEHTPATRFDVGVDDAMLKVHFRAMSTCFRLTNRNLHAFAEDALEEMSLVVAHLANQLGERCATSTHCSSSR